MDSSDSCFNEKSRKRESARVSLARYRYPQHIKPVAAPSDPSMCRNSGLASALGDYAIGRVFWPNGNSFDSKFLRRPSEEEFRNLQRS